MSIVCFPARTGKDETLSESDGRNKESRVASASFVGVDSEVRKNCIYGICICMLEVSLSFNSFLIINREVAQKNRQFSR